jgi:hypothetical protein
VRPATARESKEQPMEASRPTRILVVANRTAATPRLLDEIDRRAGAGPCQFALLIPDVTDRKAADWTLETALRLMKRAARAPVEGLVGSSPDPFESVEEVVREGDYDEIIISTLPRKLSTWLRRDLIQRVRALGVPVTPIVPGRGKLTAEEQLLMAGSGGAGVAQGGPGIPKH